MHVHDNARDADTAHLKRQRDTADRQQEVRQLDKPGPHIGLVVTPQDMADAASRAAAVGTLERLLAQPHLWAQQQLAPSPGQDGEAAASFGGSGWAESVAELAAKARLWLHKPHTH